MTATDRLPAGQSTRNQAERLAVRAGGPSSVTAADGPDPHPVSDLDDATADCRPVFPWRPVVLVMATTDAADGWAPAVELVDDLQDQDVDARLALPTPPEVTSRWVQPARASETTLRHLRPDVVVAWDAAAVEAAERWSSGLRSLAIVERTGAAGGVETVPWRIDVARGRVRGRFGSDATASDLASLVRRLAAGPQPEAPDPQVVIGRLNQRWDQVDPSVGVHRRVRTRSCVYVVGAVSADVRRAAEALAGHLRRGNVDVTLAHPATVPPSAVEADLVVLQGVTRHPGTRDLAGRRAARPTVLYLDESDLDGSGLGSRPRELLGRCGRGIAATRAGLAILRAASSDLAATTITIPTLMPAARYHELARAQLDLRPPAVTVIGWAPGDDPESAWDLAVEQSLTAMLEGPAAVRVDLVRSPDRLRGHPAVRRLRNDPQPHASVRWALFIASGQSRAPLHAEAPLLAEVGIVGVPSLIGRGGWEPGPGRVDVGDPEQADSWTRAITSIVDDPLARERLGFAAASAAGSLHRPSAADAVVNRLFGWIEGRQP